MYNLRDRVLEALEILKPLLAWFCDVEKRLAWIYLSAEIVQIIGTEFVALCRLVIIHSQSIRLVCDKLRLINFLVC